MSAKVMCLHLQSVTEFAEQMYIKKKIPFPAKLKE